ncbi:MAG: Fic family protein [Pseudomonadota bacterium]|nr:Fic family protein [Pseudomonadota bacterium]
MPTSPRWIWQAPGWPAFRFDAQAVQPQLTAARLAQGKLLGIASSLQLVDLAELQLTEWTQEAIATAQIEGEVLQVNSVRASAARRLGLPGAGTAPRDARTEATLDVLQAAIGQWQRPLSQDDLFAWHAALFPTGRSGLSPIVTGSWRTHAEPMQIVTPRLGKPDVLHYQAPAFADVPAHMAAWLQWFNTSLGAIDGVARAALAHLWFEAIHPFEDGNGRIGRALVELALAQDLQSPQRLMSVSTQLLAARADYYAQLQTATGRPELDVTPWVSWFATRVQQAGEAAAAHIQSAADKTAFWSHLNATHPDLSAAQRKTLGKLFDVGPNGFAGGMSTEKYVNLTGVSRATAYRELTDLTERGLLERTGQGRGTRYQLVGVD